MNDPVDSTSHNDSGRAEGVAANRETIRVSPHPRDLIKLILIAAIAAGIGEFVLRVVARQVIATPVFLDPNAIWLAPLGAAVVFAPVIALAWGLGRTRSATTAWRAGLATAAFLAVFDVLLLLPRLHFLALAALAAGVAAQTLYMSGRWPRAFSRLTSAAPLAFVVVVVLGGAASYGWRLTAEDRAKKNDTVADADKPNVLLLILDTVRALELSAYGYLRSTSPRLAEFSREGVQFERAVATAPWTLPTHATLLTGHYQRDLSAGWLTPLDTVAPTLTELFDKSGYETGGFIANMRYVSHEYGLARGFDVYRDYALLPSQALGSTMLGRRAIALYNRFGGDYVLPGRKDGEQVVDEFLGWQKGLGEQPYFAMLNFFDAHEPYAPDAPFDRLFLNDEPETRTIDEGRELSPAAVNDLRAAYDGSIASLDAQLGRLFDSLEVRGELDNTIVVVTSDHGEEFAEHGHLSHGNGLGFPALHVPLVVRWPEGGVPAGQSINTPVSLRDVAATIIDLAQLKNSDSLPGVSMSSLWRGGSNVSLSPVLSELYWAPGLSEKYPVSRGNLHSLVLGRFHLIAGPGDEVQLYDIVQDPFEQHDLSGMAALADTIAMMRRTLASMPMNDRGGR